MKQYDILIIGAGPGGIFSAFELIHRNPSLRVAVFETGKVLEKRRCPIDGKHVKECIHCPTCSIMTGFGGAGAFSDGKYNITTAFGGTLHRYIGREKALELMHQVDSLNVRFGGENTRLYSTADASLSTLCLQNNLHLLDASVRHLGTDINYRVLTALFDALKDRVDFYFNCPVGDIRTTPDGFIITTPEGEFSGRACVASVGRSGSSWMERVCRTLGIPTQSNRVDIGVRVELPAAVFSHITDKVYESKIVYGPCVHRILRRMRRRRKRCLSGERPVQNHHRHCAKGRPDRTTHHHPKRCRHGGYIVC